MTRDTEDTMTSPTGLIMRTATEAETTTIINRCILPGMQRKHLHTLKFYMWMKLLLLHWCKFGNRWSLCKCCSCLSVLCFTNTVHSTRRKEGYDDQWRYYPGYDASFDDDYRRRGEMGDEFDRRSVHSEQSAHSVHSSHSHHSRRSSFSSRSQQVNVQIFFCMHRCFYLLLLLYLA